jgi:hypothetical protein
MSLSLVFSFCLKKELDLQAVAFYPGYYYIGMQFVKFIIGLNFSGCRSRVSLQKRLRGGKSLVP